MPVQLESKDLAIPVGPAVQDQHRSVRRRIFHSLHWAIINHQATTVHILFIIQGENGLLICIFVCCLYTPRIRYFYNPFFVFPFVSFLTQLHRRKRWFLNGTVNKEESIFFNYYSARKKNKEPLIRFRRALKHTVVFVLAGTSLCLQRSMKRKFSQPASAIQHFIFRNVAIAHERKEYALDGKSLRHGRGIPRFNDAFTMKNCVMKLLLVRR